MTIKAWFKISAQTVASFTLVVKAILVRIYTLGKKMEKMED